MSRKKTTIGKNNLKKIGDRIESLQKSTGLNQVEFGKSIGISQSSVSDLVRGLYPPSNPILLAIQNRYSVTPEEILNGEQKKTIYKIEHKDVRFVKERRSPYLKHEKKDLLNMAAEILNSDINYSVTFASNIRHFYEAIKKDELLSAHEHKHIEYEQRFDELEKKLPRAANGSAGMGVGSPGRTGDATRKKET